MFSGNNNFANRELAKVNIEIIDRSELFNVVKNSSFKFMYDKLSKYHSFSESPNLKKLEETLYSNKKAGNQERNSVKAAAILKIQGGKT